MVTPRPAVVTLPIIGYRGAARAAVKEFITPRTEAAVPASEPWPCNAMVWMGVIDIPNETINIAMNKTTVSIPGLWLAILNNPLPAKTARISAAKITQVAGNIRPSFAPA